MKASKFKKGDFVKATKECIKDKVAMTYGRPVDRPDLPLCTYFEKDVFYFVKDVGSYGNNSDGSHWRVLVEGGTQFVHEDCFVKKEIIKKNYKYKTIILDNVEYYLVPIKKIKQPYKQKHQHIYNKYTDNEK